MPTHDLTKLRISSGLIALLFLFPAACTKSRKALDVSQKLENRIERDLNKRKSLVAGNPTYFSLVTGLEQGRQFLKSGNAREAFASFDSILGNKRYTNYPEYSYAKFYLAQALYELGVDYGALLYFADIVEKEPLRAHTHESLEQAIKIAQNLKDDELILYLASSITPNKVPLSLREEFRFFIAKDLYQKRSYKKSIRLLKSIPHRNRLYLAAQYLLGAIATKRKQLRRAITHFRKISNARSPVEYYENERIRQLANLALGRLFYERKNYPLSIVYYKKVKRDGEYFPSALYESSWALFKLHKFNEALSVLHSLNSPFFRQIFFLKSHLLRGAIFLELCLYQDAVESLSSIESQFTKLGKQIDLFARRARSPKEYYPLLSSKRTTLDGSKEFTYKSLFNLAAANRDFLGIYRYILRLKKEREILASLKRPRAKLLSRLLSQRARDLREEASWIAGRKLLLTRKLILDFFKLKDFLRYEIVSSERKILQTRSLRLAPPIRTDADLIRPKFTESLKETMMWWDYTGEYWEDELGYYLYNLKSICKDSGKKRR